jgi:hypothetical protein
MMMIEMGRFKKEGREEEGGSVGTNASGNRGDPAIETHGMT